MGSEMCIRDRSSIGQDTGTNSHFRAWHCCALIARRYKHSASWTRFSREIGKVHDVHTRIAACCCTRYLYMSTYEYWCCWCCCTYIESYHTTLPRSSRASSPVTDALAVELNRRTVRPLSRCVCFCSFRHLFCSCVAFFAFSLLSLYPRMHLVPVRIQLNSTYEDCCCCCIYEHLRGPLLLLVLVHQLVYHAVLLLCLIYHTQLISCLLYTSPSPRDLSTSRMPSSA